MVLMARVLGEGKETPVPEKTWEVRKDKDGKGYVVNLLKEKQKSSLKKAKKSKPAKEESSSKE